MHHLPEKDHLEEILSDVRHEDIEIRKFAMRRLGVFSWRTVDNPIDPPDVITEARTRLLQDPRIIDALLIASGDTAVQVRSGALLLLGHGETLEAQATLIRHLLNDPSAHVRRLCALVLQHTPNSPQKTEGYVAALQDPDYVIVRSACFALGKIGNPTTAASLRAALAHSAWGVRFHACEALLLLGTIDRGILDLLEALNQGTEAEEHNQMIQRIDEFNAKHGAQAAPLTQSRTTQAVLERARRAMR